MSYKTLKQFILRSEVLKLYRSFLRLSYKVEDKARRKELQYWIRSDFDSNKNHTEEEVIKMAISRGKLSLRELEQTIMIAK
ncbi:LYR motif-containing protein 2-like isoform X1 [Biomphalaria glabrata]|uniref:LYR motif-containing protein 2 n=1 Tax=Biomphalaria glabrata TaxID=6526 RepID=A0A2C9KGH5_BIOGL|nr:LYR motif-containing protein 2-like isoform X2 [Biomphalaria glabrata]XP_055888039.1 LYR motif-containing protein 2-like isoform X2 [Biomphalaria glabrata]KAI8758568.1 LYR motif-containing protein 2-like isoform X1 [Biomphalaria glabrata]KAI8792072.1 LYR motif-containing protein 2 isoform X1 [Biomphalaria glabrata]